jgi:hypothetical protein
VVQPHFHQVGADDLVVRQGGFAGGFKQGRAFVVMGDAGRATVVRPGTAGCEKHAEPAQEIVGCQNPGGGFWAHGLPLVFDFVVFLTSSLWRLISRLAFPKTERDGHDAVPNPGGSWANIRMFGNWPLHEGNSVVHNNPMMRSASDVLTPAHAGIALRPYDRSAIVRYIEQP